MTYAPPLPSPQEVDSACAEFDSSDAADSALFELIRWAPKNVDPRHVLLKVVALNRLYSTQIFAVYDMARHIHGMGETVDRALETGDPRIVEMIAEVQIASNQKIRNCFSFASKYCSLHRPDAYPIYDSRVYRYLRYLESRDNFKMCVKRAAWTYSEFKVDIEQLRVRYGLDAYTFKQLDKFFWTHGEATPDMRATN
jgi:hypothetical protein